MTKLKPDGTGLVYSTFLGGYGGTYGTAIAVDSAGRAYVAGNENDPCNTSYTFQACFPTTAGAVIGTSAVKTFRIGPSPRCSTPPAPTCSTPLSSAT